MKIYFKLCFAETRPGDEIFIVGNLPQLGAWNP